MTCPQKDLELYMNEKGWQTPSLDDPPSVTSLCFLTCAISLCHAQWKYVIFEAKQDKELAICRSSLGELRKGVTWYVQQGAGPIGPQQRELCGAKGRPWAGQRRVGSGTSLILIHRVSLGRSFPPGTQPSFCRRRGHLKDPFYM